MTIETLSREAQFDTRLFTIDQAREVLINLGVCKEEEVDERIRRCREEYHIFMPNDIFAAFSVADMASTFNPQVKSNFKKIYGMPYSTVDLIDRAFGGFKIDPENADLPKII